MKMRNVAKIPQINEEAQKIIRISYNSLCKDSDKQKCHVADYMERGKESFRG